MAGQYHGALFRPYRAEDERALQFPLLVVQGTDDLVPLAASRDWAAHCGNARFLRIEGAGHHPYLERPEEFFAAATTFLGGAWPHNAEIVRQAA
jgi:pimeloyl-ACP methyl ester carboxylesterase